MNVAAGAGVSALAMPLLGAGVAQWPVVLAAKVHVAMVLDAAYSRSARRRVQVGAHMWVLISKIRVAFATSF